MQNTIKEYFVAQYQQALDEQNAAIAKEEKAKQEAAAAAKKANLAAGEEEKKEVEVEIDKEAPSKPDLSKIQS